MTAPTRGLAGIGLPFLTAWDPADLPGTSVDPLGFDRGYGFLADRILPGLTNVALHPRYFSILCTAASLGGLDDLPEVLQARMREVRVLRLERLWALANVLATGDGWEPQGVRGISYARDWAATLRDQGRRATSAGFRLLSRQAQYGVIGIYGTVADGLKLVERTALRPTDDFGQRLGEAFLEATSFPRALRSAVLNEERTVGLDALKKWGKATRIGGEPTKVEQDILGEALRHDPVRRRMALVLCRYPARGGENDVQRLSRVAAKLGRNNDDLQEALQVILAFEECYACSILGFERILWLCDRDGPSKLTSLQADRVIQEAARQMSKGARRFERARQRADTVMKASDAGRLDDIGRFVAEAGETDVKGFIEVVLRRHTEVQQGKFDRGRRKLPWVEVGDDDVRLTMARSRQIAAEPRHPSNVPPHDYRLASADNLSAYANGEAP